MPLYYPEWYFSDITEQISWTILKWIFIFVYPDMDQDLGQFNLLFFGVFLVEIILSNTSHVKKAED